MGLSERLGGQLRCTFVQAGAYVVRRVRATCPLVPGQDHPGGCDPCDARDTNPFPQSHSAYASAERLKHPPSASEDRREQEHRPSQGGKSETDRCPQRTRRGIRADRPVSGAYEVQKGR